MVVLPTVVVPFKMEQIVDNKVLRIQTCFPLQSIYLEKFWLPQENGATVEGSWHAQYDNWSGYHYSVLWRKSPTLKEPHVGLKM